MRMIAADKKEKHLLEIFERCVQFEGKYIDDFLLEFVKAYVESASDDAFFNDFYNMRRTFESLVEEV